MSFPAVRPTVVGLTALLLTFSFSPARSEAQCRGGGRQMGSRSPQQNVLSTSFQRPQPNFSQANSSQQNEALNRLQLQYALLARSLQEQDSRPARPEQRQRNTAAPARAPAIVAPQNREPQPEDPEEAAALDVRVARMLLKDAGTAREQGERLQALRLRERAESRLKAVLSRNPDTKAADAAQELLAKLLD